LENLQSRQRAERRPALVSALSGEGIERLTDLIEARLARTRVTMELDLDPADGAGASWLHRHAEVLAKEMRADGRLAIRVRVDPAKAGLVRAKFGTAVAQESAGAAGTDQ
jgi:GTPase